ncbi:uncharacterized protein LOC118185572 [Stegodyphus dumicola]|uniref:uncharacterized protein LOC118185572 n=1 Tax=Stegodyphus dumicola TaxID=202533 RepID=UPI0015B31B27|nr:uncharacterized protein LOC118185572 [Stegodyphus dumicola]
MWIFIFASLLIFCSGDSESEICEQRYQDACPLESLPKLDDLSSEEVLNTLCPVVKDHIQCIDGYERICNVKLFNFPEEYENVRNLLIDICNETTQLHHEVLEAIPCLRYAAKDIQKTCPDDRSELLQLYEQYVEDEIVKEGRVDLEEERHKYNCLEMLYDVSCLADYTLNNCGGHARDGVLEIFYRTGTIHNRCSRAVVSGVFDVIAELNIEESRKNSLLSNVFKFTKK